MFSEKHYLSVGSNFPHFFPLFKPVQLRKLSKNIILSSQSRGKYDSCFKRTRIYRRKV